MAAKKDTKKKKDLYITNPYAFFTTGRSKKAIEMDYSMKAKPPSSDEKRVNRTDYPRENFYYLQFFKKHNMPIPKKSGNNPNNLIPKSGSSGTTTKKTTKSSGTKKKTSNLIPKELIPFAKKTVEFETAEDFVKWWGNYINELNSYNKTSKYPPAKIIGDLVKNGFHYDNWQEDLKTFYKVAKTEFPKTTAKKTTSKKKISEPQITEKEPQVGDIIKLKSGRIDKIIKVIPEDDWHFKRYMTQELNPPAGQEPNIGKLYYKPDINGVRDFEIIEQNPEKKITEKITQKKVKEPKKTTTKKEILDKLSSIRTYQSPLQSIHYSYKYNDNIVIKVTDNPNCFAHPLMILLDRNKNEIDKWLERYSNRREIQYETVIKTLKNNSKSEQLLPIKFIELVELDEEEKDTFAYLKTKYIAIVEIDNKKYVANPYLLKWLIKENYNIYAKKEILQDNFDTDYNIVYANFIVILKKNDEIKGVVSGLIYKDEDLTNIYREKNKIETSETTKKVSKKTPVKKSTTKISNPKDYPTLMAMRVKEKIIKDHNRCDFTKEEIEEAVDLSIRRGNETQGQIVKDAINILFATS